MSTITQMLYVCDGCGYDRAAGGTTDAPALPVGWSHVVVWTSGSFPDAAAELDYCPACAARYARWVASGSAED